MRAALAAATDLIGYIDLPRASRHDRASRSTPATTAESQRAEFALDLARRGRRVVVVVGRPGVFAMATVVAEVAAQEPYTDVEVTVLPGVTAASAVAAASGHHLATTWH